MVYDDDNIGPYYADPYFENCTLHGVLHPQLVTRTSVEIFSTSQCFLSASTMHTRACRQRRTSKHNLKREFVHVLAIYSQGCPGLGVSRVYIACEVCV